MTDSVEVRILGAGSFRGQAANVADYSATEDATPQSLVANIGGVGSLSFEVGESADYLDSAALRGELIELYDPYAGELQARVDSVRSEDQALRVTALPGVVSLASRHSAAGYRGTLGGAINYYLSLAGMDGGAQIDPDIGNISVILPPWNDVVWTQIQKLGAIHGFEVGTVGDAVVVRATRLRTVDVTRVVSEGVTYATGEAAAVVVVEYEDKVWGDNQAVYPDMSEPIFDRRMLTVGAGETVTTNYSVNAYLQSIQQPTHVLNVPADESGLDSVYSVVDKDGEPVTPGDWENGGGMLTVAIGRDGKSVDVTVRGTATQARGPYRIAGTSDDRSWQYGSLYLIGTGVFFTPREVWSHTGAPESLAPADSEIRISEPLVCNTQEAWQTLSAVVQERAGFSAELTTEATAVNRRGEVGGVAYPTFTEFDASIPDPTFSEYDTTLGEDTFADFDLEQAAIVSGDFENQSFGGVGGARRRYRDAWYRIETASTSPASFSWRATPDTTFDEFDSEWGVNADFDAFDAAWGPAGLDATHDLHDAAPLRVAP